MEEDYIFKPINKEVYDALKDLLQKTEDKRQGKKV